VYDSENPRKEEDSGNSVNENEKSTEKIDIDSGLTSEQNEKDNCDKNTLSSLSASCSIRQMIFLKPSS
jgi:hypothetical protein